MSKNLTTQPCAIILTALPIEHQEVCAHVDELNDEDGAPRGTSYQRGSFRARGCNWSIGLVSINTENLGTGLEVERAINHFKPNIILFVGIANGLNKVVEAGDIVAATKVYTAKVFNDSSNQSPSDLQPGPAAVHSAYPLIKVAQTEARNKNWLRSIKRSPVAEPKVFVAPIIAMENVVHSSYYPDDLCLNYPDAVAIEEEDSNFLQAVRTHQPRRNTLIIRGIARAVDDREEAPLEKQRQAARHASAFAFSVLAKLGSIEPNTHGILPHLSYLVSELQDACTAQNIRIFYSYAREDEPYVKKLQFHLAFLKRLGLITDWYAGRIVPGENRLEQAEQHLNTADIILLLISPDFINSEDLYRACTLEKRRRANEAIVVPILLRPTDGWQQYLAPGNLPSFPRNGKAIADAPNPDTLLLEVVREIRSIAEKLRCIRCL